MHLTFPNAPSPNSPMISQNCSGSTSSCGRSNWRFDQKCCKCKTPFGSHQSPGLSFHNWPQPSFFPLAKMCSDVSNDRSRCQYLDPRLKQSFYKVQTLMFWRTSFLFFSVWPIFSTFLMLLRKLILISPFFRRRDSSCTPSSPSHSHILSAHDTSPPHFSLIMANLRVGSLVLHW